jgi:RNA polymerase sigma-70 factor (ECF subfamily)
MAISRADETHVIERDDRSLVSHFVRFGDEAAFRGLYRRHADALYRLIVRMVGGRRSADDVLQITWIRAAENLNRFRWESSLRSWLVGIALNCCRESLRGDRRRGTHELCEPAADLPEVRSNGHGLRIDLERAIASLPKGYREVLVLHDVEGYTHLEIAELLGIEPGTSKSQLSRARRALRRRLTEDPATGLPSIVAEERVER